MITVEKFVRQYCESRSLPAPSPADLQSIGNMVGHHFRRFWAPSIYKPGEIIPDSGFMMDNGFVVNFYPDSFHPEMVIRTGLYFGKKLHKDFDAEMEQYSKEGKLKILTVPEGSEKKRKRIKKVPENKKP